MKRFIIFSIMVAFALTMASSLLPGRVAAVDVFSDACNAGGASSAVCQDKGNNGNPIAGSNGVLLKIANLISLIAGVVATVVVIIAGFRYVTSAGEPAKAQAAKNTLIYSLVGLAVISVANIVIRIVLSNL